MKRSSSLGVIACLILVLIASVRSEVIFLDSFDDTDNPFNPYDVDSPYAWYFFNPYDTEIDISENDGVVSVNVNPFTWSVDIGEFGSLDHVKMLSYHKRAGVPGTPHEFVKVNAQVSVTTYGTENNPFGEDYVSNSQDDIRLASCALNTIDFSSFVVADFFLTNQGVWAYYERLPFGRTEDNFYRAFSSTKRVVARSSPDEFHDLSIEYNSEKGTLTWFVDGKPVLHVVDIGVPPGDPDCVMIIDHGGVDEIVKPTSFNHGFGCFTLLDALDPWDSNNFNSGLLELSYSPGATYVLPENWNFEDDDDIDLRLFGQGAEIRVAKFQIIAN
jgi:hypothetical protein